MHHSKLPLLGLILAAIHFGSLVAASAETKALPSRQNNEGQVMVLVTPLSMSNTENWRFAVQLTTHVAPITQDIAAVSVLSDGKGHDEKPLAWQGDPPGGHHRKGVLLFKSISPLPDSVTLKIRQVGSVPERAFTWKLTNQ